MNLGAARERVFFLGLLGMLLAAGLWRSLGPPTRGDVLATVRALRGAGEVERAAGWLGYLLEGGAPGSDVERERDGLIRELLATRSPRCRALAWNLAQAEFRPVREMEERTAVESTAESLGAPVLPVITTLPPAVAPTTRTLDPHGATGPSEERPESTPRPAAVVVPSPLTTPLISPPIETPNEPTAETGRALARARAATRACDFATASSLARLAWELGAAAEVGRLAAQIQEAEAELARLRAAFDLAVSARDEGPVESAIKAIAELCPDGGLASILRTEWQQRSAESSAVEALAASEPTEARSLLAPVCAALAAGEVARAAALLDSVPLATEALESLAGAVYFNASLAAVRAGKCAEGRRLAARAAKYDDPFRVPSNVSWWKTLVRMRDCTDFNLTSSLRFLNDKEPSRELCPTPQNVGPSL